MMAGLLDMRFIQYMKDFPATMEKVSSSLCIGRNLHGCLLSDKEQEDRIKLDFANQVLLQIDVLIKYDQQVSEEYLAYVQESFAEAASTYTAVDIDIVEYVSKLIYLSLSPSEAKSLFYYLKQHEGELEDYVQLQKYMVQSVNRCNST
ncbi:MULTISPECIES: hypothetical protein [unclassified Paenibacillus]|uniref:hypothetical protein n=1 Tax=unclassified Paenibacillus TaxID=185978 RepID=UPI0024051B1A|nr:MULTISPECIES: hypothetical protein [unclassified Paenibacillus]MDF9841781.1 hypothetical protein [Paenibacillus sp. PastF-2]MDF9848538.1 hypothetical protein [Paenibacillus sp. PastM-2]MDF9854941.1 hypothetical protein [Paenibacillus sp. PastF-1]MDH6480210.1 hypothetical protein [Paenibacillus sp. PastH-2]MDH6507806.1 hypothetical protein [Paenibacillus sp. PastM-3]